MTIVTELAPRDTRFVDVNGVHMYVETYGDGTPLVLLHGGMLTIDLNFAALIPTLAKRHRVIGVELQGHGRTADIDREITPAALAGDVVGMLDQLGIDRAHVVGSSMGGMIAQKMAIEFPDRVLSLTSKMSSTGEPEYGQSTPEAQQVLFASRPADRDGYVAAAERELVWASRRYGDAAQLRALAAASYDRAYYPAGVPRQLAAMILDGSRAEALKALNVPTLVIHGLDDTLIDPSGGRRTAELVPGARLLLVEDMGHDRPPALWPHLVDAITEHTDIS